MFRVFFGIFFAFLGTSLPAAPATADGWQVDPQRGVVTIAPLLEMTTPAVVNISVQTRVPIDQSPLMRDPFFRRFF